MSIITVGGHEVTRNLNEPSDQTIMHIDVYADYLSAISPQTTSRALRALLTRGGSKSVRVENRYTEAYGPHEVMLNIDGMFRASGGGQRQLRKVEPQIRRVVQVIPRPTVMRDLMP